MPQDCEPWSVYSIRSLIWVHDFGALEENRWHMQSYKLYYKYGSYIASPWLKALVFPLPKKIKGERWAVPWFLKNFSIGSPSQTSFRLLLFLFIYLFIFFFFGGGGGGGHTGGGCKKDLVRRENRQVWHDFPYPKEIFLAL